MKLLDILDREIKVGDVVANATHCTSRGELRRSIVKSHGKYNTYHNTYHKINVKSINFNKKTYKYVKGVFTKLTIPQIVINQGNTNISGYKIDEETFKFNVIRLGSLEESFTPEELTIISMSKIKIDYE